MSCCPYRYSIMILSVNNSKSQNRKHSEFIFLTMNIISFDNYLSGMAVYGQHGAMIQVLCFWYWHIKDAWIYTRYDRRFTQSLLQASGELLLVGPPTLSNL